MKFIGRKAELAKLNAEYERDGGFVVIYGRRRVGKTTLIKEFLKKKTAFYSNPINYCMQPHERNHPIQSD